MGATRRSTWGRCRPVTKSSSAPASEFPLTGRYVRGLLRSTSHSSPASRWLSGRRTATRSRGVAGHAGRRRRAGRADAESTVDRLTNLLWEVQSTRGGVQRLVDRIAAVFVPLVVVLAVLATGGHLVTGATLTDAMLTGLAVLVVSCPCALGLATPLATAAGIRRALDGGTVVTGDAVFETATDADVVAFDRRAR